MSQPTPDKTRTAATEAASSESASSESVGAWAWPTPDPTLPPERLTDRELIARAEYCEHIAHTASPTDQAAALRDLDAAWDEAERRAAHQPPLSLPAQIAGYIGLVRDDHDHALAAETATWRQHLHAALPPSSHAPNEAHDDAQARRIPTPFHTDDRTANLAPVGSDAQEQRRPVLLEDTPWPHDDVKHDPQYADLPYADRQHGEQGEPNAAPARYRDGEDRVIRDPAAGHAAVEGRDGDQGRGPFIHPQGRRWPSTAAVASGAAGTGDPARAHDTAHLGDHERLRRRVDELRAEIAARGETSLEVGGEQWRERLVRWHDADHDCPDGETNAGVDGSDSDRDGEPGWGR